MPALPTVRQMFVCEVMTVRAFSILMVTAMRTVNVTMTDFFAHLIQRDF